MKHSNTFAGLVLWLNDQGVPWENAQWAAGQATCRYPEGTWEERVEIAMEVLARDSV